MEKLIGSWWQKIIFFIVMNIFFIVMILQFIAGLVSHDHAKKRELAALEKNWQKKSNELSMSKSNHPIIDLGSVNFDKVLKDIIILAGNNHVFIEKIAPQSNQSLRVVLIAPYRAYISLFKDINNLPYAVKFMEFSLQPKIPSANFLIGNLIFSYGEQGAYE